MTTVHVSMARDDGTGTLAAVSGSLYWEPTTRREDGTVMVLPQGFPMNLVAGEATAVVLPTGLTWCYRVTERVEDGTVRYVSVPTSATTVEYVDLPDVDPTTLVEWSPADPEAAYTAALAAKVDEPDAEGTDGQALTTDGAGGRTWTTIAGGVTSVDGETGAVSLSDTYAPLGTVGVDPDDVGFDLVLLIGQSNMSGRGTPYNARTDPADSRVFQYASSGTYADQIAEAFEPLGQVDTPSGIGPGLPFARWYASSVSPNRRVLLVPCAKGGTLLSTTNTNGWRYGITGGLTENAITQTRAALAAAGDNSRIVAALWIQGEGDGDAGITASQYETDLDALIAGLRSDLSAPDMAFIVGGLVWEILSVGTTSHINAVHGDTPNRNTRAGWAAGLAGYTTDNVHYTAAGQRIMGRNMFEAWRSVENGVNTGVAQDLTAPSIPANLTATPSGETGMDLAWTASTDNVAVTGYEYRIDSGTAVDAGAGTTEAVSGLTSGVSYTFEVRAYDATGNRSAWSPSVAQTAGTVDTTDPTWTATFTIGTPTETTVVATASALAADAVGVAGYEVSYDGGSTWAAITPSGFDFTLSGTQGTTYSTTQLRAVDTSDNTSTALDVPSYTLAASADETPPTAGTLAGSDETSVGFTLTVTGAADETALDAAPYAFSTDNGSTWTAYQAAATYTATGLDPATAYTCQHRVKDAAGNVSTGTAITVTTSAWSPANLSSLLAWFDASDASTITEASGAVSQWDDKSGNGHHVSQSSEALKPATGTRTQNSLNVLDFASDLLVSAAFTAVAQPITAAYVGAFDAAAGLQIPLMLKANISSSEASWAAYLRDDTFIQMWSGAAVYKATAADVNPHLFTSIHNGASSAIRIDAVQEATGNAGINGADRFAVGDGRISTTYPLDGMVGEIVVCSAALSGTDLSNLESYLMTKWGIT